MIFYLPVQECKLFCAFIFQLWEPLIGMFKKLCIQKMDKSLIYKGNYLRKECLLNVYYFFFTCRVRAVVTKNIYWSFLQLLFKVRKFSLNLIDFTFGHIFMLIFDSKENLLYTSINVKWTWSLFYDLLVHFLNKLT